jgi:hypothetical protein
MQFIHILSVLGWSQLRYFSIEKLPRGALVLEFDGLQQQSVGLPTHPAAPNGMVLVAVAQEISLGGTADWCPTSPCPQATAGGGPNIRILLRTIQKQLRENTNIYNTTIICLKHMFGFCCSDMFSCFCQRCFSDMCFWSCVRICFFQTCFWNRSAFVFHTCFLIMFRIVCVCVSFFPDMFSYFVSDVFLRCVRCFFVFRHLFHMFFQRTRKQCIEIGCSSSSSSSGSSSSSSSSR